MASRNSQFGSSRKIILDVSVNSHVPVLVPIADGAIPAQEYPDGYHLSPTGAQTNTIALARAVPELIATDSRMGTP